MPSICGSLRQVVSHGSGLSRQVSRYICIFRLKVLDFNGHVLEQGDFKYLQVFGYRQLWLLLKCVAFVSPRSMKSCTV